MNEVTAVITENGPRGLLKRQDLICQWDGQPPTGKWSFFKHERPDTHLFKGWRLKPCLFRMWISMSTGLNQRSLHFLTRSFTIDRNPGEWGASVVLSVYFSCAINTKSFKNLLNPFNLDGSYGETNVWRSCGVVWCTIFSFPVHT